MSKKVFVGMSGGVDSSVTAALLKEQGYTVTGVYMKNWSQDLPGMVCPWKEDYQDAKRVAVQLDIPFKMYDFEKQYRHKVVNYMIREYQAGRTPNPDIMCNQEIKFKLFLETALEDGADLIATGHYARLKPLAASPASGTAGTPRSSQRSAASESPVLARRTEKYGSLRASTHPGSSSEPEASGSIGLFTARNKEKDQTYFLYRVNGSVLEKCLMPIGEFATKDEVRALAKKFGLATADKKDSQGICFVGQIGIKDFLLHELGEQPHGNIIDQNGRRVGEHDGAIFYTIGQRHGLNIGGGLPFYVTGKDMKKNEVYVTTDLQDKNLWSKQLHLTDVHWIQGEGKGTRTLDLGNANLQVRTRYRAPLVKIRSLRKQGKNWQLNLQEDVRALTPGQSAVIYADSEVLGGGIIV